MSLIIEILEGLWNTKLNYKGVPVNIFGVTRFWEDNKNSYRSTLSRLHKIGLVERKNNYWVITKLGKAYCKQNKRLLNFNSPFQKTSPKNLLLMFDIPESRQTERKWFRKHLIKFSYFMIQKSVWVGPSPLSKEFLDYIKKIKLNSCIKIFKLAKPYQINNS